MAKRLRTALSSLIVIFASAAETSFESEIAAWRKDRESRLKAPDGWLSLVGLHWLKPGKNEAPGRAGSFTLSGDKVLFSAAPGANVILNGKPVKTVTLQDDRNNKPDILEFGGMKLNVIRRGQRFGI